MYVDDCNRSSIIYHDSNIRSTVPSAHRYVDWTVAVQGVLINTSQQLLNPGRQHLPIQYQWPHKIILYVYGIWPLAGLYKYIIYLTDSRWLPLYTKYNGHGVNIDPCRQVCWEINYTVLSVYLLYYILYVHSANVHVRILHYNIILLFVHFLLFRHGRQINGLSEPKILF